QSGSTAMRSAGANQAISSASRCVAAASAHTMATNRACDAASVPSWAIASASADPTSGGTEALRPASGGAGSNLGSAAGREDGGEETGGGTREDNSDRPTTGAKRRIIRRRADRIAPRLLVYRSRAIARDDGWRQNSGR